LLSVDLDMTGSAFSQQLDLTVALKASDGKELASTTLQGEMVGRILTEQIQSGAVRKTFELKVDSAAFSAAIASDERPELEITVRVR
jgi:hypothetical protein